MKFEFEIFSWIMLSPDALYFLQAFENPGDSKYSVSKLTNPCLSLYLISLHCLQVSLWQWTAIPNQMALRLFCSEYK